VESVGRRGPEEGGLRKEEDGGGRMADGGETACHPERQRRISCEVLVARLATMVFEKIPHLPAGRAPALGMTTSFLRPLS
jgi:hypothetical protein